MSYCVHCGVELASTEKRCPLCGIESIDPLAEQGEPSVPLFVPKDKEDAEKRFRFSLVFTVGLLLWAPVCIALFVDAITSHSLSWSLLVAGAVVVVWVVSILPLLARKTPAIVLIFIDYLVSALYVFLILGIYGDVSWFTSFTIPLCLGLFGVTAFICAIVHAKKVRKTAKTGYIICLFAFVPLLVEVLLSLKLYSSVMFSWSLYAFVSLIVLGFLFLLIAKHQTIIDYVQRRFFI